MSNQPEETPLEVPEADAVEQRLSAIPDAGGDEFNPLPDDASEADVLEQRTPENVKSALMTANETHSARGRAMASSGARRWGAPSRPS